MAFTKKHAREGKEMAGIARKMAHQGKNYVEIEARLKELYPDASRQRIRSASAKGLRQWRGDLVRGRK